MFGTYSQCLCWLIFTECFYVTTFDNNTSKLIEQMLWGGGGRGALNNLQYVFESVDGYRPGKV